MPLCLKPLDHSDGCLQQCSSMHSFDLLVLIWCAGTDILVHDPLGHMQVSAEGVQHRDQMVWQAAAQASCP
jgi:acetoin utilization deacetylase AcuC-like enzyme